MSKEYKIRTLNRVDWQSEDTKMSARNISIEYLVLPYKEVDNITALQFIKSMQEQSFNIPVVLP